MHILYQSRFCSREGAFRAPLSPPLSHTILFCLLYHILQAVGTQLSPVMSQVVANQSSRLEKVVRNASNSSSVASRVRLKTPPS